MSDPSSLPVHNALLPSRLSKWTERLAFDVAMLAEGALDDTDDVLDRHNVTKDELILLTGKDKQFKRKVASYRADIRENGITFRNKARVMSEMLLTDTWELIHSSDVTPTVKADLIKSTVKWADLEPKRDAKSADPTNGFSITINLGDDTPAPKTVSATKIIGDI